MMALGTEGGTRRALFLAAAERLFFAKGYARTSVRDILDEVGEKSASPSVFYHYFPSKDALYHAVMEARAAAYVRELEDLVGRERDWPRLVEGCCRLMRAYAERLSGPVDAAQRLLYLDLKERVSGRLARLWARLLRERLAVSDAGEAEAAGLFLSAGIGELLARPALGGREACFDPVREALRLCLRTLELPPEAQAAFASALKAQSEQDGRGGEGEG